MASAVKNQYSAEYNALSEMTESLYNSLPIDDLLPKMISKRVIDFSEKAEIRSGTTDSDKIDIFLSKLTGPMASRENRRFYSFIQVMKESPKCQFLVDRMEGWISHYKNGTPPPLPVTQCTPQQSSRDDTVMVVQQEVITDTLSTIDFKLMHEHVIPRISADWETVAAYLEYSIATKNLIKKTNRGLPRECCTGLLEDWITSDNGVKPKTWEKFVDVLSQISSLAMVTKQIKQCLCQEGVLGGAKPLQRVKTDQPSSVPDDRQSQPTALLDTEKKLELQKEVFTNCRQYIVQYLNPNDIADHLISKHLIGENASQELGLPIKTAQEKNRTIVNELSIGGPDTLDKFCEILKKNSRTKHIADKLEKEWRRLLQPSPTSSEQTHYSTPTHTKITKVSTALPQESTITAESGANEQGGITAPIEQVTSESHECCEDLRQVEKSVSDSHLSTATTIGTSDVTTTSYITAASNDVTTLLDSVAAIPDGVAATPSDPITRPASITTDSMTALPDGVVATSVNAMSTSVSLTDSVAGVATEPSNSMITASAPSNTATLPPSLTASHVIATVPTAVSSAVLTAVSSAVPTAVSSAVPTAVSSAVPTAVPDGVAAIPVNVTRSLTNVVLATEEDAHTIIDDEDSPGDSKMSMTLMSRCVVSKISHEWEEVAAFLEYSVQAKNDIKKSYKTPSECCTALLEDWATTDNGVKPKTWKNLVEVLGEIEDLEPVMEDIKQDLLSEGVIFDDLKDNAYSNYGQPFDDQLTSDNEVDRSMPDDPTPGDTDRPTSDNVGQPIPNDVDQPTRDDNVDQSASDNDIDHPLPDNNIVQSTPDGDVDQLTSDDDIDHPLPDHDDNDQCTHIDDDINQPKLDGDFDQTLSDDDIDHPLPDHNYRDNGQLILNDDIGKPTPDGDGNQIKPHDDEDSKPKPDDNGKLELISHEPNSDDHVILDNNEDQPKLDEEDNHGRSDDSDQQKPNIAIYDSREGRLNADNETDVSLVQSNQLGAWADKYSCEWIEAIDDDTDQMKRNTQILLVTANQHEYNAVLSLLNPVRNLKLFKYKHCCKIGPLRKTATYVFGKFGAFNVAVHRMVAQGPAEAQDVIIVSASCFGDSLHAIIAVGVACGIENKSDYLDVLISDKITFYQYARYSTIDKDKLKITNRDVANLPTSSFLLDVFNQPPQWPINNNSEIVARLTKKPVLRFGTILSGNKLVDNKKYKEELLENFSPGAIGIEMEGAGLFHNCSDHNYEILIVKSVCDFGDGKKDKKYQPTAALLAAECVKHYLSDNHLPQSLRNHCCRSGLRIKPTNGYDLKTVLIIAAAVCGIAIYYSYGNY